MYFPLSDHLGSTSLTVEDDESAEYAKQFGLTPSARGRLNLGEPEEVSLAEALFKAVRGVEED